MYSWDNAQVVLVGNKCDLEQDRAVTQERGKRLADQLGNLSKYCILDVRAYCGMYFVVLFALNKCCVVCYVFC
jgi:GTPase SAR1 family protein